MKKTWFLDGFLLVAGFLLIFSYYSSIHHEKLLFYQYFDGFQTCLIFASLLLVFLVSVSETPSSIERFWKESSSHKKGEYMMSKRDCIFIVRFAYKWFFVQIYYSDLSTRERTDGRTVSLIGGYFGQKLSYCFYVEICLIKTSIHELMITHAGKVGCVNAVNKIVHLSAFFQRTVRTDRHNQSAYSSSHTEKK